MSDDEMRVKIARVVGMVFTERPQWNHDATAIVWKLRLNYPPEGDWENNPLMVGLSGEVRRVADSDAQARIAAGEQWENCSPNYPKLLDAMNEAEATLNPPPSDREQDRENDDPRWVRYEHELCKICPMATVIRATARQRAEAFIATVCPS